MLSPLLSSLLFLTPPQTAPEDPRPQIESWLKSLGKFEPSVQVALWQIAAGNEAAGMKLLRQVPLGQIDPLGMVGRELENGRFGEARSWLPKIQEAARRDYAATAIDWEE